MITAERQWHWPCSFVSFRRCPGPMFGRVKAGSLSPSVRHRWRRPSEGMARLPEFPRHSRAVLRGGPTALPSSTHMRAHADVRAAPRVRGVTEPPARVPPTRGSCAGSRRICTRGFASGEGETAICPTQLPAQGNPRTPLGRPIGTGGQRRFMMAPFIALNPARPETIRRRGPWRRAPTLVD